MRQLKMVLDLNTLGITYRSLRLLRNEIARRVDHDLLVVEVPTTHLTSGYLIIDRTANEAVFTGDGFRTDGGGEGGAGYRAAEAYLDIFRLNPYMADPVDMAPAYEGNSDTVVEGLRGIAEAALKETSGQFIKPSDTNPSYMRGYVR